MATKFWVIASGKGGVGKTFVSTGLGITLAKQNKKVLLVDCDLSGANLHTHLGDSPSKRNISSFLDNTAELKSLITTSKIPNLSYVAGAWDMWSHVEITSSQIKQLFKSCTNLGFEIVIFDLGAGVSKANLEFFSLADKKFLVTDTEPTSVEKNYRFLEAAISYSLKNAFPEAFIKLQIAFKAYRNETGKGLFSFKKYLETATNVPASEFKKLNDNTVCLIVNGVRSRPDQDLGHSIKTVCNKFYDLNLQFIGCIDFDNAVWQSVKNREVVLLEKPFSGMVGQFSNLTKEILSSNFDANFYKAAV